MAAAKTPSKRKRKCKGKTKAGKPCGANPLRKGTVINGVTVTGKWCRTHDPDLPDSARIQGAQPGAGRPRVPRPTEVAAELVNRHIEKVVRPYWRALGYDVVHNDETGELDIVALEGGGLKMSATFEGMVVVSEHEDIGGQVAVAEKLQDRAHGKPTQRTEVTGAGGGAVRIEDETFGNPELRKAALELAQRVGNARAGQSGGAGSGD